MTKTFLDECVRVREYAQRHNRSPATGYNWVQRGLPVLNALGQMLVHIPTADEWMRSQTHSKNRPRRSRARSSEPEARV